MSYVLESEHEFERLERQSGQNAYDFRQELAGLSLAGGCRILDAGCGSGIVSRYLATRFPGASVVGFDSSGDRIQKASDKNQSGGAMANLQFVVGDLTCTPFPERHFDVVLSRFVLEHLTASEQTSALAEMMRVLKPGGQIWVIDVDGLLHNVFPRTQFITECLQELDSLPAPDFWIGRKLTGLLSAAGFTSIHWRIQPMEFNGEQLVEEADMTRERFSQAAGLLTSCLGERRAREFQAEYMACLASPNAVLFYSKFIVRGHKPHLPNR